MTHYDYDNLGRVTWTKTYASDDIEELLGTELRAESNTLYDDLGRVYETDVYSVGEFRGHTTNY